MPCLMGPTDTASHGEPPMRSAFRPLTSAALLSLLLASGGAAQGRVHIVDAAGGTGSDFTTVNAAVLAALDGEVIVVRSGLYPEVVTLGTKSLTVTAETGALVRVRGLSIHGVSGNDRVTVRGLRTEGTDVRGLLAFLNFGTVWIEDCLFRAPDLPGHDSGGALIVDCPHLALTRCTFEPARAATGLATATLEVASSSVVLHDVSATGPPDTGAALQGSFDADFEITGGTLAGGDGFDGIALSCDGQDGGSGLRLLDSASAVLRGATVTGGAGGVGFGTCPDGLDGPALAAAPGAVTELPREARGYAVSSPVRAGAVLTVELAGRPNDLVWILWGSTPNTGPTPAFLDGSLLLGGSLQAVFFGALPATGTASVDYTAPALAPGLEGAGFLSQAIFREAGTGLFHAGAPSLVTLLDAAF